MTLVPTYILLLLVFLAGYGCMSILGLLKIPEWARWFVFILYCIAIGISVGNG